MRWRGRVFHNAVPRYRVGNGVAAPVLRMVLVVRIGVVVLAAADRVVLLNVLDHRVLWKRRMRRRSSRETVVR